MNFQSIFQNLFSWVIIHGTKIIVILFIAWLIVKISRIFILRIINVFIEKSSRIVKDRKADKQRKETLIKVLDSFLRIIIWLIALLTILPEFGVNPAPLLAGAGLVGLAIGMGSRNLVQDYLAGLFILLEDQYRIGEELEFSGKKGEVIDLNLRRTIIKDKEGVINYIPNGQIKIVSNLSRKWE